MGSHEKNSLIPPREDLFQLLTCKLKDLHGSSAIQASIRNLHSLSRETVGSERCRSRSSYHDTLSVRLPMGPSVLRGSTLSPCRSLAYTSEPLHSPRLSPPSFYIPSLPQGICLEAVGDRGVLLKRLASGALTQSCSHPYCFVCVVTWAERTNTCPMCKVRFNAVRRAPARRTRRVGETVEVRYVAHAQHGIHSIRSTLSASDAPLAASCLPGSCSRSGSLWRSRLICGRGNITCFVTWRV